MDLKQSKLTKTEWNNTEITVSDNEIFVLKTIVEGFHDRNLRKNIHKSMFLIIKIDKSLENEIYLYKTYFQPVINKIIKKYELNDFKESSYYEIKTNKNPKKADVLRINNMESILEEKKNQIFEYVLLDKISKMMKAKKEKKNYEKLLYTLIKIKDASVINVNRYVLDFVEDVITFYKKSISLRKIISNSDMILENNVDILKYQDITLYMHQKELFTAFQNNEPKLTLYVAPTGTGKTLSPIGLSEKYRVLFICVSRHIGLALAKSAISMNKRIAFAFGCETASDIRLHYFAASVYDKNKRSGGIGKVDNSVGDKVEIMICDVQSYLTAMYYMLSFNDESNIVTYWDEPTITMDYDDHELHQKINRNWSENKISKMVLSCATLPSQDEITAVTSDFMEKFPGASIQNIKSAEYKKSISILNSQQYCILPHLLYDNYDNLASCVNYCKDNETLLRYFDLREVVRFIDYINDFIELKERYLINNYFESVESVTMSTLKKYYLKLLTQLTPDSWESMYNHMKSVQTKKFDSGILRKTQSVDTVFSCNNTLEKKKSVDSSLSEKYKKLEGMYLTTTDAHTLTHGPTIYLADNVKNISDFCLKMSNIPSSVLQRLISIIKSNNVIQEQIEKLDEKIEDKMNKMGANDDEKDHKASRKEDKDPEIRKLTLELEVLRSQIKNVELEKRYVPNTEEHQTLWNGLLSESAYSPSIDSSVIKRIMEIDVIDSMKLMLLMGIGCFDNDMNSKYVEIMKELAYNQNLYIIIATTDYIYGTNYSFCHGYIGKDLTKMTQQKIIQALGRIGRNNTQLEYTVRFRDDNMIKRLFEKNCENKEAYNMNRLFVTN